MLAVVTGLSRKSYCVMQPFIALGTIVFYSLLVFTMSDPETHCPNVKGMGL